IFEIKDKIDQLPLTKTQKKTLTTELQGIPNEDRIQILNAIVGTTTPIKAKSKLDSLLKEIEQLENKEQWKEVLVKLDKSIELAEFIGDQALFNKLLTKIDEINATKDI
ncbi:MAG: hypothetical protein ACFFD2_17615, partial [Promethearchaeota archaeon]